MVNEYLHINDRLLFFSKYNLKTEIIIKKFCSIIIIISYGFHFDQSCLEICSNEYND